MSKLQIIPFKDANGVALPNAVKASTRKPEWGSVLVMTTTVSIKDGLINESKRVAAFRAKLTTFATLGLAIGGDFNESLKAIGAKPMTIAVKESLTPQFEGHTPKINPSTNEVVKNAAGQPVFYNTILVEEGENQDVFVDTKAVAVAAPVQESQIA